MSNKKKSKGPEATAPTAPDKFTVLLTMLNNANVTSKSTMEKINTMIAEKQADLEQLRVTKLRLEGAISVTHKILTNQIPKQ